MSFVPTMIGAIIMGLSLFGAGGPLLAGHLKLISLASGPQNFIKNSLGFLKYIAGPGG